MMTEGQANDQRIDLMRAWLDQVLSVSDYHLELASGDASFRRYFRLSHDGHSYIVMDAPPDKEDSHPFVGIAQALRNIGLNAPEIIEQDLAQGFLMLSDLGDTQYQSVLSEDNVDPLYADAMRALLILQSRAAGLYDFPPYDHELLMREMQLFPDWLLQKHLGLALTDAQAVMLQQTFELLAENALSQPQVPVHRDYHSRNLMRVDQDNPGILDFQDAVIGPVTYDLVSLLRDCYIRWPRERVEAWALDYQQQAMNAGILPAQNEAQFLRWFDLMGVQRHLKAAGIFARLNHRDGKPGYLDDIPRTVGYIIEVSEDYTELAQLRAFLLEYFESTLE